MPQQLFISLFCLFFFVAPSQGQSIVFEQLFQPSIRLNNIYSHDFSPHKDRLITGQSDLNCIIPIASKLKVDLDWSNLFQLKFKEAAKLKFYQLFWNCQPRVLLLSLDYQDSNLKRPFTPAPKVTYGLSTGITGIHMTGKSLKKPTFLFYRAMIGLMEDYQSIQRTPIPTANVFVGMAHLKGLKFIWYYGVFVSFNNGQFVPIPFLGIQTKIGKRLLLNATLPIQIKLGIKVVEKFRLDVEVGIANIATAFGYQEKSRIERHAFSTFRIRTGLVGNIKLHPQFTLILEGGLYPYQLPTFNQATFEKPNLGLSAYAGLSFFYTFKKSLLESTIDKVLSF